MSTPEASLAAPGPSRRLTTDRKRLLALAIVPALFASGLLVGLLTSSGATVDAAEVRPLPAAKAVSVQTVAPLGKLPALPAPAKKKATPKASSPSSGAPAASAPRVTRPAPAAQAPARPTPPKKRSGGGGGGGGGGGKTVTIISDPQ